MKAYAAWKNGIGDQEYSTFLIECQDKDAALKAFEEWRKNHPESDGWKREAWLVIENTAADFARLGGSAKSPAKSASSAANGKLGGRPSLVFSWIGRELMVHKNGAEASVGRNSDGTLREWSVGHFTDAEKEKIKNVFLDYEKEMIEKGFWA